MPAAALLLVALLGPAAVGPETAVTSASDPASAEVDALLVQQEPAAEEDLGFFEEYFPLSLADDIQPATDDLILPFWLSSIFLPFGFLWAPYVFGDVKPGNGYLIDALLIAVFHALASACLMPCSFCPPVILFHVINGWYLMPVAFLNAYDRSIKEKAPKKPEVSPEPKQRKKRKRPVRQEVRLGQHPLAMAF